MVISETALLRYIMTHVNVYFIPTGTFETFAAFFVVISLYSYMLVLFSVGILMFLHLFCVKLTS